MQIFKLPPRSVESRLLGDIPRVWNDLISLLKDFHINSSACSDLKTVVLSRIKMSIILSSKNLEFNVRYKDISLFELHD